MPRAKFDPDPLKTVAVHKEQRNTQIRFLYVRYSTYLLTNLLILSPALSSPAISALPSQLTVTSDWECP